MRGRAALRFLSLYFSLIGAPFPQPRHFAHAAFISQAIAEDEPPAQDAASSYVSNAPSFNIFSYIAAKLR